MNKDNKLLENILRIRELIGTDTQLINEQLNLNKVDLDLISKSLGLSDETSFNLSKEADKYLKNSDEFAKLLTKQGLDDIGKIQKKLYEKNLLKSYNPTKEEINNALTLYFKKNPAEAKEVLKSMSSFSDNVIRNLPLETIFKENPDMPDLLRYLTSGDVNLESADIRNDYQELIGMLYQIYSKSKNQELLKIIDLMKIKLEMTNTTNKVVSSATPEVATTISDEIVSKDEKQIINYLIKTQANEENMIALSNEIATEIVKLENTISTYPGTQDISDVKKLLSDLKTKEKEITKFKVQIMGGNQIGNPYGAIKGVNVDKSIDEDVKMADWVWNNWWRGDDIRGAKTIAELDQKAANVERHTFYPNQVKITNKTIDSDNREYYELLLPTNEKVILYKSTGTGAKEYKQKGDWQIINGFGRNPNNNEFFWVIKGVNSTQYTKGGNKYFTDLSNYLKNNGDNPSILLGPR